MAFFFLIIIFFFSFFLPQKALANWEGLNTPNNKIGIHLAIPSHEDLSKAAELVNSSNGDWGYVTLVIHEDDLDKRK